MLHELQSKLEFRRGATGNETAARASDTPSLATAAARQRETDLIMEALVREYLNGTPVQKLSQAESGH
jgi:hypothetical protein